MSRSPALLPPPWRPGLRLQHGCDRPRNSPNRAAPRLPPAARPDQDPLQSTGGQVLLRLMRGGVAIPDDEMLAWEAKDRLETIALAVAWRPLAVATFYRRGRCSTLLAQTL